MILTPLLPIRLDFCVGAFPLSFLSSKPLRGIVLLVGARRAPRHDGFFSTNVSGETERTIMANYNLPARSEHFNGKLYQRM